MERHEVRRGGLKGKESSSFLVDLRVGESFLRYNGGGLMSNRRIRPKHVMFEDLRLSQVTFPWSLRFARHEPDKRELQAFTGSELHPPEEHRVLLP